LSFISLEIHSGTGPSLDSHFPKTFLMFRLRPAASILRRSFYDCYNVPVAGLSDELSELRSSVHAFAQKELAPRAAEIDRLNEFPKDMWKKMGDMGLLGITAPEEYGGHEMGYLAHTIVMEEISRAAGGVALSYGGKSGRA
jgi:isovaleryl-CoA dehydrogenase